MYCFLLLPGYAFTYYMGVIPEFAFFKISPLTLPSSSSAFLFFLSLVPPFSSYSPVLVVCAVLLSARCTTNRRFQCVTLAVRRFRFVLLRPNLWLELQFVFWHDLEDRRWFWENWFRESVAWVILSRYPFYLIQLTQVITLTQSNYVKLESYLGCCIALFYHVEACDTTHLVLDFHFLAQYYFHHFPHFLHYERVV